jgi:hypothetical protein
MRNQYTQAYYTISDKRACARQEKRDGAALEPAHPIQTKSLHAIANRSISAIFQQKPQKGARPKSRRSLNCEAIENEMEATSNGQDD